MSNENKDEQLIKTTAKIFNIIEEIQTQDGGRLSDISDNLNLPKSTLHAHLKTLENLGYLRNQNGVYHLSFKFLDHGIYVRERHHLVPASKDILHQIAEDSGEAVWLVVEEYGKAVYLESELGDRAIKTHAREGKHEYMHCLAAGKVILAYMPKERVFDIVEQQGLPAKTEFTITDVDELIEELEFIRDEGYAVNDQETALGVYAVSAPIIVDGNIQGAVAISGPSNRLQREENRKGIINLVTVASNEIELKIKYQN